MSAAHKAELSSRPTATAGRVSLVGAGPGDPELLTLKAVRAIREASVLLVDDLVSDAILELVQELTASHERAARLIHVGKRGGCKSTPQAFIEQLMLREALAGERVVRLKGGDPFVFGRGGEEAEHLRAHGIEVEVVNGITAGLAAATSLGAPLTHRDHAHGVILVTGHARDEAASVHWPTLAAAAAQGLTLVIYMGVSEAARLQHGLRAALPDHTPVAVVERASQPGERRALTTLGGLLDTIHEQRLGSPSIIIVGDVLRGVAQWAQSDAADAGLGASLVVDAAGLNLSSTAELRRHWQVA